MDKLWSPWRSKYIDSFKPGADKEQGCLFCRIASENKDKENYLLHRSEYSFIIMNLYPYNSGHLMVVPNKHTDTLNSFGNEENIDFMNMINLGCEILKDSIVPHGFNVGVNIGKVSGAGIEEHVHFHIVPRWNGDTNFMPVLNEVKVVSEMMDETYKKLRLSLTKILEKKSQT